MPKFKIPKQNMTMKLDESLREQSQVDLPTILESVIIHYMGKRPSTLDRQKLKAGVILSGKTYLSPHELMETEPNFKGYVEDCCSYAKQQKWSISRLINRIRMYSMPIYGWLNYRPGIREDTPVVEDSNSPLDLS
jgi:hypothetical protein